MTTQPYLIQARSSSIPAQFDTQQEETFLKIYNANLWKVDRYVTLFVYPEENQQNQS